MLISVHHGKSKIMRITNMSVSYEWCDLFWSYICGFYKSGHVPRVAPPQSTVYDFPAWCSAEAQFTSLLSLLYRFVRFVISKC
jgi:hypothetical protein